MKKLKVSLIALATLTCLPALSNAQFTLLSNISANIGNATSAGEIVAFDSVTDRLFVTSSGGSVHRINVFDMSDPSAITAQSTIDYSLSFSNNATNMRGLSSVALNSAKGFGVAALIPTANATTFGKVGFFNLSTGANIGTLDVGYHPDSLTFSPDGSKLIVVNEGEWNSNTNNGNTGNLNTNPTLVNAPGSISIIDISSINSGNLANLLSLTPTTRDFTAGNFGSGVSLSGIRNSNIAAVGTSGTFINTVPDFTNVANQDPNAIEPEYASVIGDKVYVSLQENNAIGEFDLAADKWTKITNLGTITQTIDATDTGNTIAINKSVRGLPMPDTIATYTSGNKTYVVTANEGDARNDDRDVSRFGDIAGEDNMGNSTASGIIDTNSPSNFPLTQTGVRANDDLGRLNISRLDGDTDGDGKIDAPTMIGTRSFTIWEVTGAGLLQAYDSGSFFETYIRDNDGSTVAGGGWVDGRSDDKGPEPEALVLGQIDGRTYAFIGMERNNGIFMFDVTDPLAPTFNGYTRTVLGNGTATTGSPYRPEGMQFVSAADSPNGQALLIVGFEGDGTNAISERIVVYSVIPEPSTYALLAIAGGGILLFSRRRAKAKKP